MATHRTAFEVDASPEEVWAVIADFAVYPDWNPSIPAISGELREGEVVSLTLAMPGRPSMGAKAELLEVTPNRRLTWEGHLGADRIFTGRREFAVEPLPGGRARVTHVEDLRGLVAPLFEVLMRGPMRRHHDGLNRALKDRVEGAGQSGAGRPRK
jgi:hypothetical protein